jgi:hypothetical protein
MPGQVGTARKPSLGRRVGDYDRDERRPPSPSAPGSLGSANPITAARADFNGIRPTDAVQLADPTFGPSAVVVVREDKVVAIAYYRGADLGGWLIDHVKFCTNMGISG